VTATVITRYVDGYSTYTAQLLDSHALDCRVISTAKNGKYKITTDYLTDPAHDSVVAFGNGP